MPVTAGTSDAFAEALSVGATEMNEMMVMYGSTVCLFMPVGKIVEDERVWSYTIREGRHGVAMCTATSGAVTKWFKDNFAHGLENTCDTLSDEAGAAPAGAKGLIVLPYFSGERSPVYDANARGMWVRDCFRIWRASGEDQL